MKIITMEGKTIGDYKIGKLIGSGSFGVVHEATHCTTNELFAIKIDTTQNKRTQLRNEHRVYADLKGLPGILKDTEYGVDNGTEYLVMPRLYKSLAEIIDSPPPILTEASVAVLGVKLVEVMEGIHSRGRIYRDMKPENVMVDYNDKIFVVDFGLSKYFINTSTKEHNEISYGHDLSGTARYASMNMHDGIEQSRRDDLESLGYVLVYLINRTLPWTGIKKATGKEQYFLIGSIKKATETVNLCDGIKGKKYFIRYFDYVRALRFDEKPDYKYLQGLFHSILRSRQRSTISSEWLVESYFNTIGEEEGCIDSIVRFFTNL